MFDLRTLGRVMTATAMVAALSLSGGVAAQAMELNPDADIDWSQIHIDGNPKCVWYKPWVKPPRCNA